MPYHHTDTLGNQIIETRRALHNALEALGDLEDELRIEREVRSSEVARLVDRAEAAERKLASRKT